MTFTFEGLRNYVHRMFLPDTLFWLWLEYVHSRIEFIASMRIKI